MTTPAGARKPASLFHDCRAGDTHACVAYVVAKTRVTGEERVWLLEIPGCESTWEADPPHNGSFGLFQFQPSTWSHLPSWISSHSILDPLWSTWGAWWLYHHDGNGREWTCTARLGLY